MNDYKKQMSDQYRQRSDHRIEFFRQQAQADTEEQREQLRREYDARMKSCGCIFRKKATTGSARSLTAA
jgi:Spy/CpxP family protein refolding chaperone